MMGLTCYNTNSVTLDPINSVIAMFHCIFADPMDSILSAITKPRSRHMVIKKILEMGLVNDKSELRKKRKTKEKSGRRRKSSHSSDEELANNREQQGR